MLSRFRRTTRRSSHKTPDGRTIYGERHNPSAAPYQQAPAELNAMFGYGTSSSFPLFWTAIIAGIKKVLIRRKTSI